MPSSTNQMANQSVDIVSIHDVTARDAGGPAAPASGERATRQVDVTSWSGPLPPGVIPAASVVGEFDDQLVALVRTGSAISVLRLPLNVTGSCRESIARALDGLDFLHAQDIDVVVELDGFFALWADGPVWALEVLAEVLDAGAEAVVLGGTTAGLPPEDIGGIVETVCELSDDVTVGVALVDTDASAASVRAVAAGARLVTVGDAPGRATRAAVRSGLTRLGRTEGRTTDGRYAGELPAERDLLPREAGSAADEPAFTVLRWNYSLGAASKAPVCGARLDLVIGGRTITGRGEGPGIMRALEVAAREALEPCYPDLDTVALSGWRTELVDDGGQTLFRVAVDFARAGQRWTTSAVDAELGVAYWCALRDGFVRALCDIQRRDGGRLLASVGGS
jgi:hypothetical protein